MAGGGIWQALWGPCCQVRKPSHCERRLSCSAGGAEISIQLQVELGRREAGDAFTWFPCLPLPAWPCLWGPSGPFVSDRRLHPSVALASLSNGAARHQLQRALRPGSGRRFYACPRLAWVGVCTRLGCWCWSDSPRHMPGTSRQTPAQTEEIAAACARRCTLQTGQPRAQCLGGCGWGRPRAAAPRIPLRRVGCKGQGRTHRAGRDVPGSCQLAHGEGWKPARLHSRGGQGAARPEASFLDPSRSRPGHCSWRLPVEAPAGMGMGEAPPWRPLLPSMEVRMTREWS